MNENEEKKSNDGDEEGIRSKIQSYVDAGLEWFNRAPIATKIIVYLALLTLLGTSLFFFRSKNTQNTTVVPNTHDSVSNQSSQSNPNVVTSPFPKSLENTLKGRNDQQNNALAFESNTKNSQTQRNASSASSLIANTHASGTTVFQKSNKPDTPNISTIALYFKDTTSGQLALYQATTNPDPNIIWKVYTNNADGYSIDYPYNWVPIKIIYVGHEGMAIYPIGVDSSLTVQDGLRELGFGWSPNSYQLPFSTPGDVAYSTPITISGVDGILYTQGVLGSNNVAAIFPYRTGYFGIGGTANTDDMIFAFRHMLSSLHFVGQ